MPSFIDNPRWRLAGAAALLALTGGCLGEPPIDERWTLLEFASAMPAARQAVPDDQPVAVSVRGRITYRAIRTGFLVAELRYSESLSAAMLPLDPDEHTFENALAVEHILANSVTAGRATQAVTGFDHLMQSVNLEFTAPMPAAMSGASGDSLATRGLFLVLYMGEGDEVELPAGGDTLVVTPFDVEQTQVLFCGYPLRVVPPAAGAGS